MSVLHQYECWVSNIKGEHRLRMFRDRVLRKILGPKGELVTGREVSTSQIIIGMMNVGG